MKSWLPIIVVIIIVLCVALIACDRWQEAMQAGQITDQMMPASQTHDAQVPIGIGIGSGMGREGASSVMLPVEIAASRVTVAEPPPEDLGEAVRRIRADQSHAQQAGAIASLQRSTPARAVASLVDAVNAARPSLADGQGSRSASINPFNASHD